MMFLGYFRVPITLINKRICKLIFRIALLTKLKFLLNILTLITQVKQIVMNSIQYNSFIPTNIHHHLLYQLKVTFQNRERYICKTRHLIMNSLEMCNYLLMQLFSSDDSLLFVCSIYDTSISFLEIIVFCYFF